MIVDSTLQTLIKYRLKQLSNRFSIRYKKNSEENSNKRRPTLGKSKGGIITVIAGVFILIFMFYQCEVIISSTFKFATTKIDQSSSEHIDKTASPKDSSTNSNPISIRKVLSLAFFLLFLYVLFVNISTIESDTTEPALEWLVTMPVHLDKLMKIKILEHAIVNLNNIFFIWPFITIYLFKTGLGITSIPLSILMAFMLSYIESLFRAIIDPGLRMIISIRKLSIIKSIIALLSIFPFFILISTVYTTELTPNKQPFLFALSMSPYLDWLTWTPTGLLISIFTTSSTTEFLTSILILGLEVFLIYALSFKLLKYLFRQRVIDNENNNKSKRVVIIKKPLAPSKKSVLTPIQKRDFKVFIRNKNRWIAEILILIIAVFGVQLFNSITENNILKNNLSHLLNVTFILTAYSFTFSLFNILREEVQALWILYTSTKSIEKILVEKFYLKLLIALRYPVIIIGVGIYFSTITTHSIILVLTVLLGIIFYGIIAASLGVLVTTPLPNRGHQMGHIFLYLIMVGFAPYIIYANDFWLKIQLFVFLSLTALALLKKAKDNLPYVLDPTAYPKSKISLTDGIIAAQLFFIFKSLILTCLYILPGLIPNIQLISFALAGFFVFIILVITYYRDKTIGVPKIFGKNIFKATIHGIFGGISATVVAIIHLLIINHYNFLPETLVKTGTKLSEQIFILSITLLVAPLFEEFLFRGIIFKGALRKWSLPVAVIISSSIFAIIHPAISVIPVFFLAVFAALSYAKTKLLITPIIVHAIYNFAVVLLDHYFF